MISMQRILVPTDFSGPSEVALKYGKAFSETFGAALYVLHVVEDGMVISDMAGIVPINFGELLTNARRELQGVLSAADCERYRAQLVTVQGSPSLEICSYALGEKIDLIIMGTHGRSPIAHVLMGSVAEKVVRKAPCPVLTVRKPEHEFVVP